MANGIFDFLGLDGMFGGTPRGFAPQGQGQEQPPRQGMMGRAFGGLSGFNENHPGLLIGAGNLIAGKDMTPALMYGLGAKKELKAQRKAAQQENATKALAKRMGFSDEEIEAYAAAGKLGDLMKPKEADDYVSAGGGRLFNKTTGEWVVAPGGEDGGEIEYGLNPVWGKDPEGKDVLGVLGKDGTFKPVDTGDVTPLRGIEKVDLGTEWGFVNKSSGELIRTEPKDLRGAEREKGIGEAEGKAAAAAPGDYQSGQNALDLADQIATHPGLDSGTGVSSLIWNNLPANSASDFQNLVDQAKSGAFLTAIQQMRGLGALSNAEGGAATQAVTRMNTATSKEAFLAALADYRKIVEQGMANAQRRAGKAGVEMNGPPAGGGDTYKQKYGLD